MSNQNTLAPDTAPPTFVAFSGDIAVGAGSLHQVAEYAKAAVDAGASGPLLIVNAVTSEPLELDLRGSLPEVLSRLPPENMETDAGPEDAKPTRGRPRLGVVAREVTLLPRHWQWLSEQRGGASVTLRRLVEQARAAGGGKDRLRRAQESAYRFLSAMVGNQPGFEEATRALFAGDGSRFAQHSASWPIDLRTHAMRLADTVFREKDALHA